MLKSSQSFMVLDQHHQTSPEVANLMPSAASMLRWPYTIFLPLCMAHGLYVQTEDEGLRRHFPVASLAIQASYLPSTSIFLKE